MISAGHLIGVFAMCFVFILGAYMYGHSSGYDEGFTDGARKAWCHYKELLNLIDYAKERQAMKDD